MVGRKCYEMFPILTLLATLTFSQDHNRSSVRFIDSVVYNASIQERRAAHHFGLAGITAQSQASASIIISTNSLGRVLPRQACGLALLGGTFSFPPS
jgi:hypothetical protein